MVEEAAATRLSRLMEREEAEAHVESFEARVHYLSSSLIVTIPVKVARELGLRLGDRVHVRVQKMREAPRSLTAAQKTV